MRTCVAVLFFCILLTLNLAAAPRQRGDEIPLRNWQVPFESIGRSATSSIGNFQPVGDTAAPASFQFVPVTPCRIVDTRTMNPPIFQAGDVRSYTISSLWMPAGCPDQIPVAAAYSLNFTIANYAGRGSLKAYPTGVTPPNVSILNYGGGLPLGNAAIVAADAFGSIDVATTVTATPGPTHVIIDINGYFIAPLAAAAGANLTTYSNAGAYMLTVPAGVTRMLVEAWGGGGGGGIPVMGSATGGDGGYARALIPVSPGITLTLTVGGGGAGAPNAMSPNGSAGGDTRIDSNMMLPLLTAGGGGGGTPTNNGAGGSVSSSSMAILFFQRISGATSPSQLGFVAGSGGAGGAMAGSAGKAGLLSISFVP